MSCCVYVKDVISDLTSGMIDLLGNIEVFMRKCFRDVGQGTGDVFVNNSKSDRMFWSIRKLSPGVVLIRVQVPDRLKPSRSTDEGREAVLVTADHPPEP